MSKPMFRVVVADDEKLIANNIAKIITDADASFEISAICYDGESAFAAVHSTQKALVKNPFRVLFAQRLFCSYYLKLFLESHFSSSTFPKTVLYRPSWPPLKSSTDPVIYAEASEAKNSTASAASSSVAILPAGICFSYFAMSR